MGLFALLISVVIDTIWPLHRRTGRSRTEDVNPAEVGPPVKHPLWRHAVWLVDRIAPAGGSEQPTGRRVLSIPGWLALVGIPVVLVVLALALAQAIAGVLVFVLHVGVLYLCVGLGGFLRRFSELRLLVGAGEDDSARLVLATWPGADEFRTDLDPASPLAARAVSHSLLCVYREVFAPLFWYAVLPGPIGPVLYLFSRFAACLSGTFAQSAYYWLDWIPLRLAGLVFALAGQFEDTIFYLKSVSGIRPNAEVSSDPYLHQRLLLLPAAGGALGLRLTDDGIDAQLRAGVPDLDLPAIEPEAGSLRDLAGLLFRSSVIWTGIYLLLQLIG